MKSGGTVETPIKRQVSNAHTEWQLGEFLMSTDLADETQEKFIKRGLPRSGICLILGGVDTGKTTLAAAIAGRLAASGPVGIIDADVGQSHIGPPATVGWAIVEKPQVDFSQVAPRGISFVGDVTPVGHLLQLAEALTQCVGRLAGLAAQIIIDTPGFIDGPAATALWWTVQRILQPKLIVAVQRDNELSNILAGLRHLNSQIELLEPHSHIPAKSPQARRSYRQSQFRKYFQDAQLHALELSKTTIQTTRSTSPDSLLHRLVALRSKEGIDHALGIIEDWQPEADKVTLRSPLPNVAEIRCLVMGDVSVDLSSE
jgi:polynucleotide 5'-kinase involved in rRNA processing